MLIAGAYDYNREYSATGFTIRYDSPALRDGRLQKAILAGQTHGATGLCIQPAQPDLPDRRVREALTLLWDFEWTNKQMMRNFYTRQHSYFPNTEMAATELPTAQELAILNPCGADSG